MAKKKAPQRLAGAEESCISPEQEAIIQWFRTVKFRKNLLGGVDEASMWKKLEELYALYEAAIRAERTRYNVLLAEQKGLPLNAEPDSFAKGSPTRGAVTAKPVTERFSPDAGTATAVTERFNPESDSSDPQKEAHSDAPAGQ